MTPGEIEAARQMLIAHEGAEDAAEMLYARWYHATDSGMRDYPPPAAYLAAILAPARFEPGWTVTRAGLPGMAGAVEIARQGRRRVTVPPLVAPANASDLVFEDGMAVLAFPLAALESGGFWHVTSPAWEETGPPEPRRRLYFAIRDGAERAFAQSFTSLADPGIAWSVKLLTGRCAAGRRDPAVAYLPADLPLASGWLAEILETVQPFLGEDLPPGTRRLGPGIASAPDTRIDRSFGQCLCDALAAIPADPADAEAWRAAARRQLAPLLETHP